MKFIKSISLAVLFTIYGISGAFAQDDNPDSLIEPKPVDLSELSRLLKPLGMEPYPFIKQPDLRIINSMEKNYTYPTLENDFKYLTHEIVGDAYVLVFGNFGGEEQFFDGYLHDRDFPEGVQYSMICDPLFWEGDKEDINYLSRSGFLDQEANCSEFDGRNVFPLIHTTSQDDRVEFFVIPLIEVRRSRSRVMGAVSEVQELLDAAESGEYMTAFRIRQLIDDQLTDR